MSSSPSPEKERLTVVLEKIKSTYPKILDPDLDLISEVVAILGEESPDKVCPHNSLTSVRRRSRRWKRWPTSTTISTVP
ncbi:MAG: hypothetical protein P4M11_08745 [Candidatus Pacebacteria bacterium]|nr:hypothetical protein [Candidatus Paceibacterota bacterium]